MNAQNAIARIRFAAARPQRVRLDSNDDLAVEMLCMEAGQDVRVTDGAWCYYVVMGTATVSSDGQSEQLAAGGVATFEDGEKHALANTGEGRLVCLAARPA